MTHFQSRNRERTIRKKIKAVEKEETPLKFLKEVVNIIASDDI